MSVEKTKLRAPQSIRLSARRFFWIATLAVGFICAGALIFQNHARRVTAWKLSSVIGFSEENSRRQSPPAQRQNKISTSSVTPSLTAEPDADSRQMIAVLCQLPLNGALTSEQIAEWKRNFQQLIREGAASVPAIREFLKKNVDVDFGADGRLALGYNSARMALFDVLQQIGGADATELMLETLRTTADPREIASLADDLEQQSPGSYQADILNAVRETLTVAANGKLSGTDVAPLFEVLQKYGGDAAVSDLKQAAGQWKYYATLSLAQLSGGTGIPSLIQMAQNSNSTDGSRDVALQVLAQTASENSDAAAALINSVRQNQIPASLWPYLVSALTDGRFQIQSSINSTAGGGSTFHIAFGNQNFYTVPFNATQIQEQLSLVNELLSAASNPDAIAALQKSQSILSARMTQVAFQN